VQHALCSTLHLGCATVTAPSAVPSRDITQARCRLCRDLTAYATNCLIIRIPCRCCRRRPILLPLCQLTSPQAGTWSRGPEITLMPWHPTCWCHSQLQSWLRSTSRCEMLRCASHPQATHCRSVELRLAPATALLCVHPLAVFGKQ
jgi:hypothetical protein